jgi:spermidine/putrescine transport system substrate-binding protein
MGAGAALLPPFLASCHLETGNAVRPPFDWKQWWGEQQQAGVLDFANWPYYLDRRRDNSHPSLLAFTEKTGIRVNYSRPIRDNQTFLDKISPALREGRSIGYDIIVLTNGPQLSAMIDANWLIPLDHRYMEFFRKNASDLVRDPPWDAGNTFTIAWQSGLTGIGYRPEAVQALGRKPKTVMDLWDPALSGRVGMLADEMDLGSFGLLAVGVDPAASTQYDWSRAAIKLRQQRESGVVRKYYDQGYLRALQRGDIWISQAWSGDIFQSNQLGYPELEFVVPEEGAMFWTDNMMIPLHAEHPVDAMIYMDSVYHRNVAATIADWVWYITPVPSAEGVIRRRLEDARVANSPLVFPPVSTLGTLSPQSSKGSEPPGSGDSGSKTSGRGGLTFRTYPVFGGSEDLAAWRRFFSSLVTPGEPGPA